MSKAKRILEEQIRLEELMRESEQDQQNASRLKQEKLEQAAEDDAIDAAAEAADLEALEQAAEDDAIDAAAEAADIEDYRDRLEQQELEQELEQAAEDDAIAESEDHPS